MNGKNYNQMEITNTQYAGTTTPSSNNGNSNLEYSLNKSNKMDLVSICLKVSSEGLSKITQEDKQYISKSIIEGDLTHQDVSNAQSQYKANKKIKDTIFCVATILNAQPLPEDMGYASMTIAELNSELATSSDRSKMMASKLYKLIN